MKIKKRIALILALMLIFSFSGCKKSPENSSSSTEINIPSKSTKSFITLLYSAADSFNPYTVKTDINRQLCKLIYDPLVKLDNEFKPIYTLAKDIKLSDKECVVTIKDVKFSDGSNVTADDVVYSCKLAMQSSGNYSAKLYEVDSVAAADSKKVVFKLKKADPYFINLLDFPIIKTGSEKKTDSDSVVQPPVGCGRYKVAYDRQSLTVNENYSGKKSSITDIKLINAPDSESVAHYVEIGASDLFFNDISNGEIIRMGGKKLDINLNNLIYIGVNHNNVTLGYNLIRQAISSGIDRKKICQNAFYNNALPATGFFNPVWEDVKAVQNIQIDAKSQITVENLEEIGYNKLDTKGLRFDSSGKKLQFTLLVNSENRLKVAAAQLIASQLFEYGIKITVIEKSYAKYLESLKNGDFQLFLGEVKLTDNMDISSLVSSEGTAAFGIKKMEEKTDEKKESDKKESDEKDKDSEKAEAETEVEVAKAEEVLQGFYSGKNSITDLATVLQTEMPFIPVCYRTGVLFYNDNIENVNNSSLSDIYFSIESYIYNN